MRREVSVTNPDELVARAIRTSRSRSRHASAMRASFSFSAGESSTTSVLRRGGRLFELTDRETDRETGREVERDGGCEDMVD